MADERGQVDADPALAVSRCPAVDVYPVPRGVGPKVDPEQVAQRLGAGGADREGRVTAIAGDVGRDALVDLALCAGIVEQGDVGVGVHVDEARRDDLACSVDRLPGR